jgi:hypothetical protein
LGGDKTASWGERSEIAARPDFAKYPNPHEADRKNPRQNGEFIGPSTIGGSDAHRRARKSLTNL